MTAPYVAFGEDVTILRRQTSVQRDSMGNLIPEYVADEFPCIGVPVWPNDPNGQLTNEFVDARDQVPYSYQAILPTERGISAYDRVSMRGQTWEVVGQPTILRSFFTGWRPGTAVNLRRTEG